MKNALVIVCALLAATLLVHESATAADPVKWSAPMSQYPTQWTPTTPPPAYNPQAYQYPYGYGAGYQGYGSLYGYGGAYPSGYTGAVPAGYNGYPAGQYSGNPYYGYYGQGN